MKLDLECLPCILDQMCRVMTHLRIPTPGRAPIMRRVLAAAARADFKRITAPELSAKLARIITIEMGGADPYLDLKKSQNRMIGQKLSGFRRRITQASDPLRAAALLALLGNVIDYGNRHLPSQEALHLDPEGAVLTVDDYPLFAEKLRGSKTLLYIADNAGEALLDGLFIEEMRRQYPGLHVFFAVRSRPAINDILADEAREIGLGKWADILPSGSAIAGTLISKTGKRFRTLFHSADLVISKGQGNFETLEEERREIFFLLKVKCPPVARHLHLPEGALLFATRRSLRCRIASQEEQ